MMAQARNRHQRRGSLVCFDSSNFRAGLCTVPLRFQEPSLRRAAAMPSGGKQTGGQVTRRDPRETGSGGCRREPGSTACRLATGHQLARGAQAGSPF